MRVKWAVWGIVLGMAAWAAVPATVSPAGAADGVGTCAEPEPSLDYQRLRIVYRMDVDLGGCSWWDGEPIEMSATLSRSDGISPDTMAQAGTVCANLSAAPAPSDAPTPTGEAATRSESGHEHEKAATPRATPRRGTCSVEVELDHPPVEEANYSGRITFPGPDGERSVSFERACHSIGVMGGCD